MQLRSLLLGIINIVSLIIIVIVALSGLPRSFAAEQPSDVPAWLRAHVGEGEGQIAQVVLQRARAIYLEKVERRHGEKSLLLRHGRDAPRRAWAAGFT